MISWILLKVAPNTTYYIQKASFARLVGITVDEVNKLINEGILITEKQTTQVDVILLAPSINCLYKLYASIQPVDIDDIENLQLSDLDPTRAKTLRDLTSAKKSDLDRKIKQGELVNKDTAMQELTIICEMLKDSYSLSLLIKVR